MRLRGGDRGGCTATEHEVFVASSYGFPTVRNRISKRRETRRTGKRKLELARAKWKVLEMRALTYSRLTRRKPAGKNLRNFQELRSASVESSREGSRRREEPTRAEGFATGYPWVPDDREFPLRSESATVVITPASLSCRDYCRAFR